MDLDETLSWAEEGSSDCKVKAATNVQLKVLGASDISFRDAISH